MWDSHYEALQNNHGLKFSITQDSSPLSYATVIHNWQKDKNFRTFFIRLLTKTPLTAYRWETPAITATTADRPFEFVLISSPRLARAPDRQTFAQHFEIENSVVTFSNLGNDAILVVPCPQTASDDYSHLAAFTKHAPQPQQHTFWQAVGHAMAQRLGATPVWLNTAGGGVAWLHVRLDDSPKYYHHSAYRSYRRT
ncbi:DUF6940 family protein [Leptothoe spongobia]|uniref:Uncharacterized protein n=1 Tax=Leptothoe spongobia TAU-MAC 1115 TaxID=1967444 RepID=A0A947DI34_9CYAN|nr:hypothetical protein [Leptothoe spongobia]MBT9317028.1 hypothetical protein [Leptothoe spongobia TAU-MAC 1115]